MRRIVVAGGRGGFGSIAVILLRETGCVPLVASRRPGADLVLDVEDAASIAAALRPGDVVLDAAGPWKRRTTALVDAAVATGFDVVDLSDDLAYALRLRERAEKIAAAGIAILSSCSTVSAVSAAVVASSGIERPRRVTLCLLPEARVTARAGSAASLLASVGSPIRIFRGGRLVEAVGWREKRRFELPVPFGRVTARLVESADAVHLPAAWTTLDEVSMFVDANVFGLNALLSLAARSRAARGVVSATLGIGTAAARLFARRKGCAAWEIEGDDGAVRRFALVGSGPTHGVAALPAALAVEALARQQIAPRGLVPPHVQTDRAALVAALSRVGAAIVPIR